MSKSLELLCGHPNGVFTSPISKLSRVANTLAPAAVGLAYGALCGQGGDLENVRLAPLILPAISASAVALSAGLETYADIAASRIKENNNILAKSVAIGGTLGAVYSAAVFGLAFAYGYLNGNSF